MWIRFDLDFWEWVMEIDWYSYWNAMYVVMVAMVIVICLYGVEESKLLIKELDDVFKRLIYEWDNDPRASRIVTQIQEYVGCCGARRNYLDYINVRKSVPSSCRHPVSGNRYRYGCPQTVAWWLEPWTSTLSGISLGFCLLDFLVLGITVRVRRYIGLVKE